MGGIAVLGTGAWGTTLAIMLTTARDQSAQAGAVPPPGMHVILWEHRPERARAMIESGQNETYLPGIPFPPSLKISADLAEAVRDRDLILIVTPSQQVRTLARQLAPLLASGTIVACASKGIELGTGLRMSEVLAQELPGYPDVALSGPNLAREIAQGFPAAAVVASRDARAAEWARAAFTTPTFRVYTSEDVIGVELGGALKNIVALGVGISDGLGYGDNAKAGFMTRALAEISRLALAAGANPLTLAGLAGLGDIIATCSSSLSRNRTLGLELASGRSLDEILAERKTVAEGVTTTRAALLLARKLGVELPITEQLARVLFEGQSAAQAVAELLGRNPKRELEGMG